MNLLSFHLKTSCLFTLYLFLPCSLQDVMLPMDASAPKMSCHVMKKTSGERRRRIMKSKSRNICRISLLITFTFPSFRSNTCIMSFPGSFSYLSLQVFSCERESNDREAKTRKSNLCWEEISGMIKLYQ